MIWDPIETEELLERFEQRGVRFTVEGEQLQVDSPAGVLTEADRIQLRERRWDIAAWLGGDRTTDIRRLSKGRVAWYPKSMRAAKGPPATAIMDDDPTPY